MVKLFIKNASIDHSELIWQWRNDPQSMKMFLDGRKVEFDDHMNWYKNMLEDKKICTYIVEENNKPIGVIRFNEISEDASSYNISINISPQKRGKGIGKFLLINGIKKLKSEKNNCEYIYASVKSINKNSNLLFKSCGFRKLNESNKLIEYVLKIN
tara:strand:+ start:1068 stop:1535 length:468 start_codon:yes stop_codon:yes gene_type:complete